MYPSYITPFWMHRRGSQLTSVPISQAFMGTEHFPLLKKTELKVSSRVVTKLAGRILKLLWITSSIQNTNKMVPFHLFIFIFFCSNTLLIHKPCMYLSVEVNVDGKAHSANLQHCLHSPPTNHPSALQTPLALGHPRK